MNRKLLVLGLFALAAGANAAGILGTKVSVAEGKFCKAIGCDLAYKVSRDGMTIYVYATDNNTPLTVVRDKNNVIIASMLRLPEETTIGGQKGMRGFLGFVNNYTYYFSDMSFKPSEIISCIKNENFKKTNAGKIITCNLTSTALIIYTSKK